MSLRLARAVALLYPRAESNCYLKFRKFLFYPLNYEGPYLAMWGQAPLLVACKDSEFILAPKGRPLGIISPSLCPFPEEYSRWGSSSGCRRLDSALAPRGVGEVAGMCAWCLLFIFVCLNTL